MTDAIKISIKDATKLAHAIAEITSLPDGKNLAVRAVIQRISQLLPENVSSSVFRDVAINAIDLTGRDYIRELRK